ncbi:MAG: tRNA (guanosine(46)-N7)-methyltransferase TrmB [Spirochaetaceae bacterium]|jgi:tRNA (guanine-N7-)-methyltransferase|nr:tRNA (guanosine(46)-N7)-methyltransferase TrmB [Spirochaetaceae bacterium]
MPIKSYVLRGGRMSAAQQKAYAELAPLFCVPFSPMPLDFAAIFGNKNPVIVEIGFGMGSVTAALAGSHPELNYLGIEVFKAGIGKLLWEIDKRSLRNVRIIEHDAVECAEKMLPDSGISGFHIFFPDPWHKKRHHKRRLVQRPFIDLLAAKLAPGAYFYFVSDCKDYAESALAGLNAAPLLTNTCNGFAPPQSWRPKTKFEEKAAAAGREIRELYFVKQPAYKTAGC